MVESQVRSDLYRRLSRIRHAEGKIIEVYQSDVMQCPVHLSIGQESIAVALCAHLRDGDLKIGTHRSHALYLANGGDLVGFFGELLGRQCGCSGGYGGSMHLIDLEHGLVGTTSIVGGALPIVVGLGMSVSLPNVAAVLFGDAAADEGVFAESVSYAQLRRAPVVFCCENNRYSVYTPVGVRRAAHPSAVAKSFGMTCVEVEIDRANDVFALYELLAEPIAAVRAGAGPLFVECQTVRRYDHNGVRDDIAAGFRDPAERELYDAYDPIRVARCSIPPAQADEIDDQCRREVEDAYRQALASEPVVLAYQH